MKKILAILLAALLVLSCFSFASADAKTYKVGVSIYQFTDNFMTLYRNEIENYFKTLETDTVKYEITMADGKKFELSNELFHLIKDIINIQGLGWQIRGNILGLNLTQKYQNYL